MKTAADNSVTQDPVAPNMGTMMGEVVQQRAVLRRNLVNRLFRLGNAVQTQTQGLLGLTGDLNVVHYRILLRLDQAGPQNVQGIAELLGTNRSVVSRALPVMKQSGWLDILQHRQDRRQFIVQLTAVGRAVLAANRPGPDARLDALNAAFSEPEFDQLLSYLDRLDAVTQLNPAGFVSASEEGEDRSIGQEQDQEQDQDQERNQND